MVQVLSKRLAEEEQNYGKKAGSNRNNKGVYHLDWMLGMFQFYSTMTTLYQRLSENWADYDCKKVERGEDPAYYSCDEAWEVFFLAAKLQTLLPHVKMVTILESIADSCRYRTEPIMRKQFLLYVLQTLEVQNVEA